MRARAQKLELERPGSCSCRGAGAARRRKAWGPGSVNDSTLGLDTPVRNGTVLRTDVVRKMRTNA